MQESMHMSSGMRRKVLTAEAVALVLVVAVAVALTAALRGEGDRDSKPIRSQPTLHPALAYLLTIHDFSIQSAKLCSSMMSSYDADPRRASFSRTMTPTGECLFCGMQGQHSSLTMKRGWKLSKSDISEVREEAVYIEATRVRTAE